VKKLMSLRLEEGINQIGYYDWVEKLDWFLFKFHHKPFKMFNVTCIVLENITKKETTTAQRDADTTSFEFVFILHKVLDMTDDLCQAL